MPEDNFTLKVKSMPTNNSKELSPQKAPKSPDPSVYQRKYQFKSASPGKAKRKMNPVLMKHTKKK